MLLLVKRHRRGLRGLLQHSGSDLLSILLLFLRFLLSGGALLGGGSLSGRRLLDQLFL